MWEVRTSALGDNRGLESHVSPKGHLRRWVPYCWRLQALGLGLGQGGTPLAPLLHSNSLHISQRKEKQEKNQITFAENQLHFGD